MTTFYEFTQQFPDDVARLKRIMVERYGGTGFDCPKCGAHAKFYCLKRDRAFLCQHCKHHIYPCVGTTMERSRTPVHKWFYAMFLFTASRHSVAAKELQRQLDVTYKCAWRMGYEIRRYMVETDGEWSLGGGSGTVEADETLVGGKVKSKGRHFRENKTTVFAMIEREGDVMAEVVPDVKRRPWSRSSAKTSRPAARSIPTNSRPI